MAVKRMKIRVEGKVQGVWFRKSAKIEADKLGLAGFVKNEPDGSVYVEVEGEENSVRQLIGWAHEGPEGARVRKVEFEELSANGMPGFEIIYT